jgi:hypothetical protein
MGISAKTAQQLAGMATDAGLIDAAIGARVWEVRDVELRDDHLWFTGSGERRLTPPAGNPVNEMVKVSDGPAALKVAQRWGPLGLCKHGLPFRHAPESNADRKNRVDKESIRVRSCAPTGTESVEAWIRIAKSALSILRVATNLGQIEPTPGTPDDWQHAALFGSVFDDPLPYPGHRAESDHLIVTRVVREWLSVADVSVHFAWSLSEATPRLGLRMNDLTTALAVGIAGAIAPAKGVAMCSGCGVFYTPSRRPRSDRRNFCEKCQASRLPQRLAERDREDRERAKMKRGG